MNDCIFCKIVAGIIPSTKVYEDETVLAFRVLPRWRRNMQDRQSGKSP